MDEAEKVKLEYGSLDIPEVDLSQVDLMANPFFGIEEILNSVMLDVLGELKRSFLHFQQHYRGQLVEKIYLTGGAAQMKGVVALLEKQLHMPVERIDLTRYFAYDRALEECLQKDGALLTEAMGLALSEV